MKVTIKKTTEGGKVKAIPSKSVAHRLMIAAALSGSECNLICEGGSEDIEATQRCTDALMSSSADKVLDCGESGSTLRFMLPVAGALGATCDFMAGGRLPQRPLTPLYEEMEAHGCRMSKWGTVPMHLEGKLRGGEYSLPGNVSSQYFTGLLMALPLAEEDSFLGIEGKLESAPYVEITLDVLAQASIIIKREKDGFRIPGGQKYNLKGTVRVEGDWSNAAFWLCMGALKKEGMTCSGLNMESSQGDRKVVDILREMGADIEVTGDNSFADVKVSSEGLRGIEIDASDVPDLVPVLAATAAGAEGTTVIKNAQRLRLKESDRLETVSTVLSALGADIEQTDDGLIIRGTKNLNGGTVDSFGDHRIAMMAATASAISQNEITITGAQAVNKSYPSYFEDFQALGGSVDFEE